MTFSRVKQCALAGLVVVAAGAGLLFHRGPSQAWPPGSAEGQARHGLMRRLPPTHGPAERGQLVQSLEEREPRMPTAATIDPDARSQEFAAHPDRTFHPGGGLLERSNRPLETAPPANLLADAGEQPELDEPHGPRAHRVVDGDTLAKLAARYLGSSDRYGEIFAANRRVLSTPDLLPIGVELVIPPRQRPAPPVELGSIDGPAMPDEEREMPRLEVEMAPSEPAEATADPPANENESAAADAAATPQPNAADDPDAELVPVPKGALRDGG